jgi:hypothetical protein
LRGASAIQHVLSQNANQQIAVLVVWEPILPTDWQKPGTLALGRIKDQRAKQFWDKDHLLSRKLHESLLAPGAPEPSCCMQGENLWDMVILYPAGVKWESSMPQPVLVDGPVVNWTEQLSQRLNTPENRSFGSP